MIQMNDRSIAGPNTRPLRYQIGDINVSVRSDLPEVLEDFTNLYRGCAASPSPADQTIRMEVKQTRRSFWGRSRYQLLGDGQEFGPQHSREDILPCLEWGINWRVIATRADYLQLHSASMAYNGQGVIFAGTSGCGKSTLAAGLLACGWRYLCDEFSLIDPDTLQLHPFPKAVCIKSGAFDTMKRMNLPFAGRRYYVKGIKGKVGYINPNEIGRQTVAGPSPIRFIIFPKYVPGRQPSLFPISPARAAFMLTSCTLNFGAFGDRAISLISELVRGARCFRLESGPLDETCSLLETLI